MATYGLTDRQRQNYYSLVPTKVPKNFIDYVQLFVYEMDDTLVAKKIIPFQQILNSDNYEEYSGVVKLNIGQHVRDFNFIEGDFKVQYKFFKIIAQSLDEIVFTDLSGNMYEGLVGGTDYNSIVQSDNTLKYFLLTDGETDYGKEIFPSSKSINIFDISPDRTELILQPNDSLPAIIKDSINRRLNLIDRPVLYAPNQTQELLNERITFKTKVSQPSEETFVLELPEKNIDIFNKTHEGKEIVFENFFEAYIPTHYHGEFWQDNWKLQYSLDINVAKNPNIKIPTQDYEVGIEIEQAIDGELISLPFMKDSPTGVVDINTFDSDKIDTTPNGQFTSRVTKEFNPQTSVLPKDVWQTNTIGPQSNGDYHFDYAGFYPYEYNQSSDSDNIDWQGDVAANGKYNLKASRVRDVFIGGYASKTEYRRKVYIDWKTTITKVLDKRTIQVKGNDLKPLYYKLRKLGYKIWSIGNVLNQPRLIEKLPFDRMYSDKFYINGELNDIQQYRSYLQTGDDFYLITNSKNTNNGRAFKLQQPLQPNVYDVNDLDQVPSKVNVISEVLEQYRDNVTLIPPQTINDTFLLPANFDGVNNDFQSQPTEYKTYNQLTSSKSSQTEDIERLLVSGSLLNVQPNIDYQKTTTDLAQELDDTGFGNFVHFSNAESRLRNFKKKLELIEGYTAESSSLTSITSATSKIRKIEKKRQRVYNSFNPYETYLYYESSSYSSGSNGIFHDTSWPKMTSTKPYKLEHTSGSAATTWFNNMILSASSYDYNNQNSLRNSLPEHVNQDSQNNVFLEFMDMVGEQFDETWTYVKSLTDINMRVNNVSEGISKDVAKYYAEALGVKLYDGNSLTDLSEYLLGKNTDGSDKNESSGEALTEETWKRILANLPYFIKTKGTERALKGILNCYGIPSSVLRVREFGGPDKGTRVSYEIKRKFTYALDFKAGQYIKVPWVYDSTNRTPQSIEFRFRTPYKSDQTIFKKGNGFAIQLVNSSSTDYGYVRFAVSSSTGVSHLDTPKLKLFNDEMWSVLWKRNKSDGTIIGTGIAASSSIDYELTAKQYDSTRQRIIYEQSSSLTVDGTSALSASYNTLVGTEVRNNTFIGDATNWGGSQFSGSLMEFRLWSEPLSQSVFDNHVRTPKAYNGNSTSSAYDNLLLRLPLDDNRNLSTNPTASNYSYIKTYQGHISGSNINGFTGNFYRSLVDQEKIKIPNVGTRRNATKIRLEDNYIPEGSQLSSTIKQEQSSQDFAPLDSNKLGVYFSPTDVINEDIIYTLADFNMDNEIGDPRDEYEDNYRGLRRTRFDYFKRYVGGHNHFFDYLRILDFYDNSVFEVLKQFVPARAKADFGNLIESNLLERNKQNVRRKLQTTEPYYENANDFQEGVLVTRFISGSDKNTFQTFGEFTNYDSVVAYATSSRGTFSPTLVHINQTNPRSTETTTYATASVTRGGTNIEFKETYQPYVENQRLSDINKQRKYYYTSSLSVSTANGFGSNWKYPGGFYVYSSSLEPTEYEKLIENSLTSKLYYTGTRLNKFNNTGGEDPVQIEIVSATSLTTTTPGDSYLDVD